jgi:hypothetical protein
MPISADQILFSYGKYLRAKAQEQENIGFGGVSFRQEIAEHQQLEAEYIRELIERRRSSTEAFRVRLEGKG